MAVEPVVYQNIVPISYPVLSSKQSSQLTELR